MSALPSLPLLAWPPRTRAECADGPRPCPAQTCRHHLDGECVLDLAAAGGMTLEEVGAKMGLTKERIRQIEIGAIAKLRERVEADDFERFAGPELDE